ncbi:MAG: hypothetical protein K9J21_04930 [Bacteroidales bacterium]|nr:hypothetical protein [Bacteroidales bacterium]
MLFYDFEVSGKSENPYFWTLSTTLIRGELFTTKGYTGHEMPDAFEVINMNGRIYDPVIARFFSPDPYVQAPQNPQNLNRYSYCLNNPLVYTDPSGELIFTLSTLIAAPFTGGGSLGLLPTAIAADIGMLQGGALANGGEMNPFKWDYTSGKTWGYMAGGTAVGLASGYVGGLVAQGGGFMANTMGIMAASHVNSVGMGILSGGQTDYTLNVGIGSYNGSNNTWGGIWNWSENSTLENIGYSFGALANLNDINNLINQTNATLYTQERYEDGSKDVISHIGIVDDATGDKLMSFGPNDNKIGGGGFKDQIGGAKPLGGYKKFGLAIRKGTPDYPVPTSLSKSTSLVVNKHLFNGLRGVSKFVPFQGATTNCVNMSSIGLWLNGIPNIGIHPYLLHYSIAAYNSGFNPYMLSTLSTNY